MRSESSNLVLVVFFSLLVKLFPGFLKVLQFVAARIGVCGGLDSLVVVLLCLVERLGIAVVSWWCGRCSITLRCIRIRAISSRRSCSWS